MKIRMLLLSMVMFGFQLGHSQSLVFFTSSPQSWIGHGQTYSGNILDVAFSTGYNFQFINFTFEGFSGSIVGPSRQPLELGLYEDTARAFFNGSQPGFSLLTAGRGDNTSTGWFNILELEQQNNVITSAAIDFMQYDEGIQSWWNFGSLRYNSSIPLQVQVPEPTTMSIASMALFTFGLFWIVRKRVDFKIVS